MPALYSKPISEFLANSKIRNLLGETFGYLLVLQLAESNKQGRARWLCLCVCGTTTIALGSDIIRGHTKSCGCYLEQQRGKTSITHGEASRTTVEYTAFVAAKGRCTNPNNHARKNYAGRGIEFRFESFPEFLAELGRRPSDKHSLDRFPDNNGHYEPGNVRWATKIEQMNNVRKNRILTVDDKSQSRSAWAREKGMRMKTIYSRQKAGWCDKCAVTQPAKGRCTHR